MPDTILPAREPRRARFDTRRRDLAVTATSLLSPHMKRIALSGDMEGFQSLGFDDHIKLFFPDPATGEIALAGGDAKPLARDYTPRFFDRTAGTLVLDFALHGIVEGTAGPATRWAHEAKPGDRLVLGGPRGSAVWPLDFALHLLIGDDTALPAIARRLAELPDGSRAIVLAAVDSPDDRLAFETRADASIHWVFRDPAHGGHDLAAAVAGLCLTERDVFAWVATEAAQARLIREELVMRKGLDPRHLKAAGYWHKGEPGVHAKIG